MISHETILWALIVLHLFNFGQDYIHAGRAETFRGCLSEQAYELIAFQQQLKQIGEYAIALALHFRLAFDDIRIGAQQDVPLEPTQFITS